MAPKTPQSRGKPSSSKSSSTKSRSSKPGSKSSSTSTTSRVRKSSSTASKVHRTASQQKTRPGVHRPSSTSKPSKSPTTKGPSNTALKKKPKYTDAQLSLPQINTIIPANSPHTRNHPIPSLRQTGSGRGSGKKGSAGGLGKKKDKVYVDDVAGMQVIWGMVQAEKEKDVEGRIRRMREWEGVRVAREEKDRVDAEGLGKEGRSRKGGEGKEQGKKVREKMELLKGERGKGKGHSDGGREATKHVAKGDGRQKPSRQSAADDGATVRKRVSFA